jgi:hypothetical protein
MLVYAISVVVAIAAVIAIAKICDCLGDWR